ILAFDDYFGYRALIDEVNVWVLPDISEEPACGLMLEGPIQGGKSIVKIARIPGNKIVVNQDDTSFECSVDDVEVVGRAVKVIKN
ncbi:hypothetical protein MJN47_31655, partial [Salmonella enterica subsp. enterica serovar Lubbock]|nr:hypothetical protein [Salmonella enterica subsp. enterica serovar Lubbock]